MPVLMISAYADAVVEAAVKRLGGLDILKKPIRRQELVARTAEVVGGSVMSDAIIFRELPATFPEKDKYQKPSVIGSVIFHGLLIVIVFSFLCFCRRAFLSANC